MSHSFLLRVAANLALAGCLGWEWSLWPVLAWLAVQRNKDVFLLTLYDSINDMNYFRTVCITPRPCHSYCSCWLLPIWPYRNFWAENAAYGLWRLGSQYNGAKLSFFWPYLLVSMIWNTSGISASRLSRAKTVFVVHGCQFGPNWMFELKMKLITCADLVGGKTEQSCLFTGLIW